MKRIFAMMLVIALLCGSALASAGFNSFFDDKLNAGKFDSKAWDGEYVYWLAVEYDHTWKDYPYNIYRMRPGDEKAEMILEGPEDLWIYDMCNIGDRLLLFVYESPDTDNAKPALIDFDGGNYREISGYIGSVVMAGDALYNSVGGHIYEIDLNTLKSKKIYSYPEDIAAKNPILYQIADDMLYFSTNTHEIYSLYRYPDADTMTRKVAEGRGSWFVYDGHLYMSDYDKKNGTWKYNVYGGNHAEKVSDATYNFCQGSGYSYIRAFRIEESEFWIDADDAVIIDLSKVENNLEAAVIGTCDNYYDVIFDGKLIFYDWENNRMEGMRDF